MGNSINGSIKASGQLTGNGGLIGRRELLKMGLAVAGLGMVPTALAKNALAETSKPNPNKTQTAKSEPTLKKLGFRNYGMPSRFEKQAIRWIVTETSTELTGTSWTPLHLLEGTITPNGLHFERHHNGVPDLAPQSHRLLIDKGIGKSSPTKGISVGKNSLTDNNSPSMGRPPGDSLRGGTLAFDLESLERYPTTTKTCFVECGGNSNSGWNPRPLNTRAGTLHGLVSCSQWSGVPLGVLLEEANIPPKGVWLDAQGADGFHISIPTEKAYSDGILALWQNGERLRPENGYPMRLVLPGFEAVTHVKWLTRLTPHSRPVMARDETAQYTELQPDGSARQFTFIMEPKSVITKPSPGYKMAGKGVYRISGLAWSGRGKIKRVEVSAGKGWVEAVLEEPIQDKAFTRFNLMWRWNGEPSLLQSRAIDETGASQPTRQKLLAQRGRRGYFHYNGITAWQVSPQGNIRHVYAS